MHLNFQPYLIQKMPFLKKLEIALLLGLIVTLPSLEGPKNIFLVLYVVVALISQIKNRLSWHFWDSVFLLFMLSILLSTFFSGISSGDQLKGMYASLTYISVGWLVYRSRYDEKTMLYLFVFSIIGVLPPLIVGAIQYLVLHTKPDLQLHSVGHVNHSAIYLAMIFGAALAATLSTWETYSSRLRLGAVSVTVILFLSLVIGQSRGALLVACLIAILLILFFAKTKKIKWSALLFLTGTLLVTVLLNAGVVHKQIVNQKNNNILSYRDKIWNVSLEAARFSPLFGLGIDNYKFITRDNIKKSLENRKQIYLPDQYLFYPHSHNLYLTVLVERGIVGFTTLILLMAAWITQLISTLSSARATSFGALLWGASFSAWLVTFGVGTVNTTMHHEHGILAFLFLALYLAYCQATTNLPVAAAPTHTVSAS